MQIMALEMENFRNHKDTKLMFDKVNYFIGKNHAGKSSISGAIQYALTGENEWISKGKGKDLINYEADKAGVELEVLELGLIERGLTKSKNFVKFNSGLIPDKELEREYEDVLNFNYEALVCSVDSFKFMNMGSNKQKEFLFKASKAPITEDLIYKFLENPTPQLKKEIKDNLGPSISFETLDGLYKKFFDERKFSKRELAAKKVIQKNLVLVAPSKPIDINKVQAEKEELAKKKESLIAEIGREKAVKKNKEQLLSYVEKNTERIKELEVNLQKGFNIPDAKNKIAQLTTEIEKVDEQIKQNSISLSTYSKQIVDLNKILKGLSTDICPISNKLICTTDKKPVENEIKSVIESSQKEEKRITVNIEKLNKDKADKNNNLKLQERLIKICEERDTIKEQNVIFDKDLKKIKEKDTKILEVELEKNRDSESILIEQIRAHQTFVEATNKKKALEKEIKGLEEKVLLYDSLVFEFGTGGVKTKVLQHIIAPIEKQCNEALSKFTDGDYSMRFSFEKDLEILVKNKYGEIPIDKLSRSERLVSSLAFQNTITQLTGTGVLIADEVNLLDKKSLAAFRKTIEEIKNSYDSMFIFLTVDDVSAFQGMKLDHTKVFVVEDGSVEELL